MYLYYDTLMNERQPGIEAEIARIKKSLMKLERMHPGSLSMQKRIHGGEYHQLSYSYGGKGHTKYVRSEDVPDVMRELRNYGRFRELTNRWIELEVELAGLRRDESRSKKSWLAGQGKTTKSGTEGWEK